MSDLINYWSSEHQKKATKFTLCSAKDGEMYYWGIMYFPILLSNLLTFLPLKSKCSLTNVFQPKIWVWYFADLLSCSFVCIFSNLTPRCCWMTLMKVYIKFFSLNHFESFLFFFMKHSCHAHYFIKIFLVSFSFQQHSSPPTILSMAHRCSSFQNMPTILSEVHNFLSDPI
jgi:hypothetical protein